MTDEVKQDPAKASAYERYKKARKWLWSAWTDEAVMVYRRSAHGKDRVRVVMVEFLLFVREVIREFWSVQGSSRAASLAYTTLLSLIPLLVAFSQILRSYFSKVFPDFKSEMETIFNVVLPYRSGQIAYHLNRFTENAQAASTFGAIIFLFISFRLFMAVEATINEIWKVETFRGYQQKIRAFTMLLFWGPILIGLSFTTSASLQKNFYLAKIINNDWIASLVELIVLFIAFTMLFWLVPSTRVKIQSAAVGGLITAIAFETVRWAFGLYAEYLFSGNLNVVYGTAGLLIIFLLALEVMWIVILLGVEISYVYQNLPGVLRASELQLAESPAFNLYFALRSLVEIARRFERREDAPSSYRLAAEFGATDRQMLEVLRKLEDAKLVKEIGGDWTGFVPGCDPDRIAIEEVVKVMEGGTRAVPDPAALDGPKKMIIDTFEVLAACTSGALDRRTIGQMVRDLYNPRQPARDIDSQPDPLAE